MQIAIEKQITHAFQPLSSAVRKDDGPTLVIDEAGTFLNGDNELRRIMNCGYSRKTAFAVGVAAEARSTGMAKRADGKRPMAKGMIARGRGQGQVMG